MSMVTVSERLSRPPSLPLCLQPLEVWGGNSFFFTVVWLTIYLAAALLATVRLWRLSYAHCLFLYFGQLQCAYVEVDPSRIAPVMPLLRWAVLMNTGIQSTEGQYQLQTRSCHMFRLIEPFCNTDTYKYSFIPSTSRQWNVLPRYIFEAENTDIFKSLIRNYYFAINS